jgi:hypothetical protein
MQLPLALEASSHALAENAHIIPAESGAGTVFRASGVILSMVLGAVGASGQTQDETSQNTQTSWKNFVERT